MGSVKIKSTPQTSRRVGSKCEQIPINRRYIINFCLSLLIFCWAYFLAMEQNLFDTPFVLYVNSAANKSLILDTALLYLDAYPTFGGVVLLSCIWALWFGDDNPVVRSRLLSAAVAASATGLASRALQHLLHTHSRPFYNLTNKFTIPSVAGQMPLNTWDSFPSDHATVLGGLTIAIWIVSRKVGTVLAVWILIVEFARIYVGAHYPSDLIGGAALSACIIWLMQSPIVVRQYLRAVSFADRWPSFFYAAAFFLSYQIATLFSDIRAIFGFNVLKRIIDYIIT